MTDFVEVDNVYILDECEVTRKVEDKNVKVNIDQVKLSQICDINNKRFRETGDKVPLIIAHNNGNGEKKVVGYAKNFRVTDFFQTGRKAIAATFEVMKDCVDEVRKYPRRSVELLINSGKLDPIALLGGTTPERDLGLLHFQNDGPKLKFSYGVDLSALGQSVSQPNSGGLNMDPLQKLLEMLESTDVFMWVKKKMKEDASKEAGMDEDLLPQEDSDVDGLFDEEEAPEDGEGSSDSTGDVPSKEEKEKMEAKDLDDLKVRLSSLEEGKTKLEAELNTLKVENAGLKIQLQSHGRKDELLKLSKEVLVDVEKELEYTKNFSDDQFKAHLQHAKLVYQKAPVGEPKFDMSMAKDPNFKVTLSAEDAKKIALHALDKNISYEVAAKELGFELKK